MDKTIEKTFFKAFELGGVVDACIEVIAQKYDLGYLPQEGEVLDEKWQNYYNVVLPKKILDGTESFDDTVIRYLDSPLIDEIENNLNECQTDTQKERYLFSLLKPFNKLCSTYDPIAKIKRLQAAIEKCNQDKAFWENNSDCKDNTGHQIDTEGQIRACIDMGIRYQDEIERLNYISHQFYKITGQQINTRGTVESCLESFRSLVWLFANRLDALLLTYNIDLMKLQEDCGIYLKSYRVITDVDYYIGSIELAQKYIEALPKREYVIDGSKSNETVTDKPQEGVTDFKDILNHNNKETLMLKLHELLDNAEKRDFAFAIHALILLGYIKGRSAKLYRLMRDEFGDIGSDSNLNKALIGLEKVKEDDLIIITYIKKLK